MNFCKILIIFVLISFFNKASLIGMEQHRQFKFYNMVHINAWLKENSILQAKEIADRFINFLKGSIGRKIIFYIQNETERDKILNSGFGYFTGVVWQGKIPELYDKAIIHNIFYDDTKLLKLGEILEKRLRSDILSEKHDYISILDFLEKLDLSNETFDYQEKLRLSFSDFIFNVSKLLEKYFENQD